jgi:hypothetical protein
MAEPASGALSTPSASGAREHEGDEQGEHDAVERERLHITLQLDQRHRIHASTPYLRHVNSNVRVIWASCLRLRCDTENLGLC